VLRELLVDDRDLRRIRVVVTADVAPLEQRNASVSR
jgi:hypothetical protein